MFTYFLSAYTINFLNLRKTKRMHDEDKRLLESFIPLLKMQLGFLQTCLPDERDLDLLFLRSMTRLGRWSHHAMLKSLQVKLAIIGPGDDVLEGFKTPSKIFDDFLRKCLNPRERMFIMEYRNDHSEYKAYLKTLESRIVLIISEGVFLPLLVLLCFLFLLIPVHLLFLFILVHLVLIEVCSRALLNRAFDLMVHVDVSMHRDESIEELIRLLRLLGSFIKDNAIELAFLKTCQALKGTHALITRVWKNENRLLSLDFNAQLESCIKESKSVMVQVILEFVRAMHQFSSSGFGDLLFSIAHELVDQKLLENERGNIIKGEQFKVKILSGCFPFILAIISAITPFFSLQAPVLISVPGYPDIIFSRLDGVYIVVLFNLVVTFITAYYLFKIVGASRAHTYALLSAGIFLACFLLSHVLLNNSVG